MKLIFEFEFEGKEFFNIDTLRTCLFSRRFTKRGCLKVTEVKEEKIMNVDKCEYCKGDVNVCPCVDVDGVIKSEP